MCWERSVATLTARKDDIAGLAVASDERIEAYLLYAKLGVDPPASRRAHAIRRPRRTSRGGGDSVAALFHRRRWGPSEATALSTRHGDPPVPEGAPRGDLRGAPGDAWFHPHRRAFALRLYSAISVMSPPRIVCARSSLSGPTYVRANVGVTPGLPPGEPGVSVRSPATDVPDVVRHPEPIKSTTASTMAVVISMAQLLSLLGFHMQAALLEPNSSAVRSAELRRWSRLSLPGSSERA